MKQVVLIGDSIRLGYQAAARAALADAIERQPEVEDYVRQDPALGRLL